MYLDMHPSMIRWQVVHISRLTSIRAGSASGLLSLTQWSGLAVFVPWLHSVHWPMATVSGQSLCVIADKADCRLCQYVVTFPGFHGLTGVLSNTCTHWPGCSALILLTNTHTLTYIHREALCKLTRCSSSGWNVSHHWIRYSCFTL